MIPLKGKEDGTRLGILGFADLYARIRHHHPNLVRSYGKSSDNPQKDVLVLKPIRRCAMGSTWYDGI
jgi:hypothetical protein